MAFTSESAKAARRAREAKRRLRQQEGDPEALSPAEIRKLAQSHAPGAIAALRSIVDDSKANVAARVAASEALLDRGYGRPDAPVAEEKVAAGALPGLLLRVQGAALAEAIRALMRLQWAARSEAEALRPGSDLGPSLPALPEVPEEQAHGEAIPEN